MRKREEVGGKRIDKIGINIAEIFNRVSNRVKSKKTKSDWSIYFILPFILIEIIELVLVFTLFLRMANL